jgi:hypothetical protein
MSVIAVFATASVQATVHKYLQPPYEEQSLVNILFTPAISLLRATARLHHRAFPAFILAMDSFVCAETHCNKKRGAQNRTMRAHRRRTVECAYESFTKFSRISGSYSRGRFVLR